ncbi:MAG TPA: hypothetical protein VG096_17505 [Bryobacteraceae bacterium]|jgi:hypothetical protein|nr:hypothetical protein [Bryobacteraceae bacterium]
MKPWVIALAAVIGGGVHAADDGPRRVNVYVLDQATVPFAVRLAAQMQASRIFAEIGVPIEWHCCGDRRLSPGPLIVVTLAADAPHSLQPAVLADALPYEGVHIRVFYDRIVRVAPASWRSTLLAHVLVHEITHVLQGVSRHSAEGIMKARWSEQDYSQMRWKPLPFTKTDIDLIARGLRETRLILLSSEQAPK